MWFGESDDHRTCGSAFIHIIYATSDPHREPSEYFVTARDLVRFAQDFKTGSVEKFKEIKSVSERSTA